MAKKVEKINVATPNPNDNGTGRPNLAKPVANPSVTGGSGDVDVCGNSPRFPRDPRFKKIAVKRIDQVMRNANCPEVSINQNVNPAAAKLKK